jgi:hypothetical protein
MEGIDVRPDTDASWQLQVGCGQLLLSYQLTRPLCGNY